ncbi:MAG: hypothetical protein ACOZJX_21290 [Pseudomonadota bacterium]
MWPLEFAANRQRGVLRIGRERAELWGWAGAGLALRSHHGLGAEPGAEPALEAELRGWLGAWLGAPGTDAPAGPVDVVLESAWLPVMLVELGRSLWSRAQVERLLRHRLAQLYMNPGDPASTWQLQLDHRAGDPQAIGYGLAPAVRQAVLGAMAASGLRAASLQPAFAWGWQRLERRRRGLREGWWTWIEQDRAVVCRIERGRIAAMNAGAAAPAGEGEVTRLVAVEAAQLGIAPPLGEAVALGWEDAAGADTRRLAPRPAGPSEVAA